MKPKSRNGNLWIVLAAVVFFTFRSVGYADEMSAQDSCLVDSGKTISRLFATSTAQAVSSFHTFLLESYVDTIPKAVKSVDFAEVVSQTSLRKPGEIVAHTDSTKVGKKVSTPFAKRILASGPNEPVVEKVSGGYEVGVKVELLGKPWGYVVVGLSSHNEMNSDYGMKVMPQDNCVVWQGETLARLLAINTADAVSSFNMFLLSDYADSIIKNGENVTSAAIVSQSSPDSPGDILVHTDKSMVGKKESGDFGKRILEGDAGAPQIMKVGNGYQIGYKVEIGGKPWGYVAIRVAGKQ